VTEKCCKTQCQFNCESLSVTLNLTVPVCTIFKMVFVKWTWHTQPISHNDNHNNYGYGNDHIITMNISITLWLWLSLPLIHSLWYWHLTMITQIELNGIGNGIHILIHMLIDYHNHYHHDNHNLNNRLIK